MPGSGYRKRRIIAQLRLLLMVAIGLSVLAAILASPGRRAQDPAYPQSGYASALTSPTASPTTSASPSPSLSPLSPTPGSTSPPSLLTSQPWATLDASLDQGLILLAMSEGGSSHLFAYHPQGVPFYRLTSGNWDDVAPSVSPDGTRVAFASNRDGFWDLYLLDLTSGETTRLTSSKEYNSAPSWSPDGRWLAYESTCPITAAGWIFISARWTAALRPSASPKTPQQISTLPGRQEAARSPSSPIAVARMRSGWPT